MAQITNKRVHVLSAFVREAITPSLSGLPLHPASPSSSPCQDESQQPRGCAAEWQLLSGRSVFSHDTDTPDCYKTCYILKHCILKGKTLYLTATDPGAALTLISKCWWQNTHPYNTGWIFCLGRFHVLTATSSLHEAQQTFVTLVCARKCKCVAGYYTFVLKQPWKNTLLFSGTESLS